MAQRGQKGRGIPDLVIWTGYVLLVQSSWAALISCWGSNLPSSNHLGSLEPNSRELEKSPRFLYAKIAHTVTKYDILHIERRGDFSSSYTQLTWKTGSQHMSFSSDEANNPQKTRKKEKTSFLLALPKTSSTSLLVSNGSRPPQLLLHPTASRLHVSIMLLCYSRRFFGVITCFLNIRNMFLNNKKHFIKFYWKSPIIINK